MSIKFLKNVCHESSAVNLSLGDIPNSGTPPNNRQKLEDRTKLVPIPYQRPSK